MSLVCDIPTAITEAETAALQAIAQGKCVLEIGALLGYSTVALAQTAKRVVSIDPHTGYPEHDPRPTWGEYLKNLGRYRVLDNVLPICATWQEAMGHLPADTLYPYEVIFIDLTGHYDDTMECLRYFHPEFGWSLKTIAVHDCGHPQYPGVAEAVEDMKDILGIHAKFEKIDRLAVFRYI